MEPTAATGLVPPWLERLAAAGWRALVVVAMGAVLAAIAVSLSSATAATLVALILAAALAPTARRLRAAGRSPTVAAAVACVAGGVVIVGGALVLLFALLPDLRAIAGAVAAGLAGIRAQLEAAGAPELVIAAFDRFAGSMLGLFAIDLGALAGTAVTVGTVVVLGTFLTFFLLQDGDKGWRWAIRSQPAWRAEPLTASAQDGVARVGWFLRRTVVLAAVDGVVTFGVLLAFGVPIAGALAALAFAAGFVPYLGAVVGTSIIALAAFTFGGSAAALAVVVSLVLAWIVATRLLERTPMDRRIDANPVLVLVAIPAGAALFGLLGLIVALPVAVFVLAIGRSAIVALDLGPGHAGAPRTDGPPVWLDRLAQWSWRGLIVAALGFAAIQVIVGVSSVVVPALIAIVAAATLLPLVRRLVDRGWSRTVAGAVATVGAATAIVVAVGLALAMSVGPLREVLDVAAQGASRLDLDWLVGLVEEAGSSVQLDAAALLANTFGLAAALALALLLTFFFLRDGAGWWGRVLGRIGPDRRDTVAEMGTRSVASLSGYMVGTAIIAAFGAFTSGLIMVLLGLPLGLPIAVLTFFASFIPYIGSFITTMLALLVAIALGSPQAAAIMFVYTIVFNIVQGNFVTPLVYGKSLSLHPAIVLMAIPVGGEIAGILGMFLVVPIAAIIAATWRLALAAIAGEPVPAEHAVDDVVAAPVTAEVAGHS
ncbi:MAG TPA: AI-2E family transporter [Candidatus Limnocylindrales bacterium]|nr:AI-2E family transporter [Candidatus Limnocylindrales bacterium]